MATPGTNYSPINVDANFPQPTPYTPSPFSSMQLQQPGPGIRRGSFITSMANAMMLGIMRGKEYNDARSAMQAARKTSDLQNSYRQDAERLKQLANAGFNDPNATPEQKKQYAQAVSSVRGSYGAMMDYYGQHLEPEKGTKKSIGGKIKGGLKEMLMSEDPMEVSRGWYQIAKQAGPPVFSEVATMNTSQAQAQRGEQQLTTEAQAGTLQNQIDVTAAVHERNKILQSKPDWDTIGSPALSPQFVVGDPKSIPGLKEQGNVNINYRPSVQNPQGGYSSVLSTSFGTDKGEVLVPRVTNGEDGLAPHILSEQEAVDYYKKYGKYLGIFDTPEHATAYAQKLHQQQAGLPSTEARLKQLENIITPVSSKGNWELSTGTINGEPATVRVNKNTGEVFDMSGNPVDNFMQTPKSPKTLKVNQPGGRLVDISDPNTGVTYTREMLEDAAKGGDVTDFTAIPNPKGLLKEGNLPIWNRPIVENADGTYSSEYSVSFSNEKGQEVLVPTVVDGKFLTADGKKPPQGSDEEKAMFKRAWQHYLGTGENLGTFDNAKDADAYAEKLHERGKRPQTSVPENVMSEYRSVLKSEDERRKDAADKAAQWFSHANYSDALQIRRQIRSLGLKVDTADIKAWSTSEQKAINAEELYYESSTAAKSPTPTSDQRLLMSWVRTNVAGAGRINDAEIRRGLNAGDYGTRLKNAWDLATVGTLAPELRNDFLGDIRNAAVSNRDEAEKLKQDLVDEGVSEDDLRTIGGGGSEKSRASSGPPQSVVDAAKEGQYLHGPNGETYQKKNGKAVLVTSQ